jgi:uncharacterized membrane protein required for colicin V production
MADISKADSSTPPSGTFFGLLVATAVFVIGIVTGLDDLLARVVGSVVGAVVAFFLGRYLVEVVGRRH